MPFKKGEKPLTKKPPGGRHLSKAGYPKGGRPPGVPQPKDQDIKDAKAHAIMDQPWRYLPHTMAMHLSEGKWIPFNYLMFVSHLVAAVMAKGGGRIIVEWPPRHGKSLFLSQWVPVWFLANWPTENVLLSTYEANFAASWGRKVRNVISKHGDELGVHVSNDSAAAAYWSTTEGGGMITAGVGGPITGKGGKLCFPAGTMVMTDIGNIDISQLFNCFSSRLVLSYDHRSGTLVWRKIIATQKRTYDGNLAEIETSGGNKIRPTWEHRVYDSERGYREANSFVPGDGVFALAFPLKQHLSGMREAKEGSRDRLQGLLSKDAEGHCHPQMCPLRQDVRETPVRIREVAWDGLCRLLLRRGVQPETPCRQAQSQMSNLRLGHAQVCPALLSGVSPESPGREAQENRVCQVSPAFSPDVESDAVLFTGVQECRPLGSDEGRRELALQRRDQLRETVSGDATPDSGAGRRYLRRLQETEPPETDWTKAERAQDGTRDPSYRRQSSEQRSHQPDLPVLEVPCDPHGVRRDSVSMVRAIRPGEITVYDLQVDGTSNFFANGILVHNCLIDDPHKNWQEAMSATICKGIQDWFDSTFFTRLEPGGTLVLTHTRWTQQDLIGYCLDQHPEENWIVIRFPALAEEEDILGRKPGEALCPERYNEEALKRIQRVLGSQMWNGLYQQRPSALEGEIWKRDRWKYYRADPTCSFVIQSWDTGFKKNDKTRTSYSVCQTWGVFPNGYCLLHQWRDRVEYPELEKMVRAQYAVWKPNAVLIEDKGSGQSLIQSLQRDSMLPVIAVDPQDDGSKVVRALAVTPLHEAGLLWLPGFEISAGGIIIPHEPAWVTEMVERFTVFPNGNFMDEIDAASQALSYLRDFSAVGEIQSALSRTAKSKLEGFRNLIGNNSGLRI